MVVESTALDIIEELEDDVVEVMVVSFNNVSVLFFLDLSSSNNLMFAMTSFKVRALSVLVRVVLVAVEVVIEASSLLVAVAICTDVP